MFYFLLLLLLFYSRTTATCNKGEELIRKLYESPQLHANKNVQKLIRKFSKDQFILLAILVDIVSQTMVFIIDYLLKNNQVLNLLEDVQSRKVRLSETVRPLERTSFSLKMNKLSNLKVSCILLEQDSHKLFF